jgi:Fe2+ or Zn2+ uptake regulation protein
MSTLIQETSKRLRLQGGRMTPQRRLILQTLETLTSHPTAEELYYLARQHDPTLNLSTVYRTLRWLEQEDLVSPRVFREERRQERFDPAYPSEHHHFMCTGCKAVIEFDTHLLDQIKGQFEHDTNALVQTGTIVLYGLCPACLKQALEGSS